MRNIIVTGANGKLSCKVADRLKRDGIFNVKQLSLRDSDWKNHNFGNTDCIVHIAGVTPQNAKSINDYENVNYLLTKDLAEKSKASGVRQFVYISSMAVYGINQSLDPSKGTVTASTPCHPKDEYGVSKLKAEEYLEALRDEDFKVCIIRVPGVFDREKTEYTDQFKHLADKYPVIPKAFVKNYKSFIHSGNLCELICLAVDQSFDGTICPDDGKFSAFDICGAIRPEKIKSRALGLFIEMFMKNNQRIADYYGAIHYCDDLTSVFGGKYRVINTTDEIRKLYDK